MLLFFFTWDKSRTFLYFPGSTQQHFWSTEINLLNMFIDIQYLEFKELIYDSKFYT